MNVYKISGYHIAAKDADSAFSLYIEETNQLDDVYIGELSEGESDQVVINIKRLTSKEMEQEFITCCWDGCSDCEDMDEPVLYSPNQIIAKNTEFPRVICRED